MTNETITKANEDLTKARANAKLVISKRNNAVQTIITQIIEDSKAYKDTLSGKNAVAQTIKDLELVDVDAHTKRALNVAKAILVDGKKIKKELLTLSQMEQLLCFNQAQINALMNIDDAEYLDAVKDLINTAKVEKTVKVFSKTKAKGGE